MNQKKLVSIAEVAREYGVVDTSGIESLARSSDCLEHIAGIPHIYLAAFRRAYKNALRAAAEAHVVTSSKPAKEVPEQTRIKMKLGKIPGRIKKLENDLKQASIDASTHALLFKRAEATRRVAELTGMIREQKALQQELEARLDELIARQATKRDAESSAPTAKPPKEE